MYINTCLQTTLHLRALKTTSVLCSRTADPDKYMSVQTAQIEAMCRLKQPDQALQITKMTDSWLKTNKLDSLKEDVLFIYYLAAKSSAFFIAGKVSCSFNIYNHKCINKTFRYAPMNQKG